MRNNIINAFYKKIFPYKDSKSKTKEEKLGENSEEELKEYINSTFTFIEEKSKEINNDLLTKCFNFHHLLIWQINYMKQKTRIKTVSL